MGELPNIYQLGDETPWLNEPLVEIDIGIEEVPQIIQIGNGIVGDEKIKYLKFIKDFGDMFP